MNGKSLKFPRVLFIVTLCIGYLLPVSAIAIWVFWDELAPLAAGNLQYNFDLMGLSMLERIAGFSISLTGAVIHSFGLFGLAHTFSEASQGFPYSQKALNGFRRFAWITMCMVPVGVLQNTLFIILYSLSDPKHQGTLEITLGTNEAKSLFIGFLLVFVAQVFADGKSAKDENATFL